MGAGHACITPHVDKGKGAFYSTQRYAFFSITPTTLLLAPVLGFISVLRQLWIIVSCYLLPRPLRISVLNSRNRMAQPRLNSDGRVKQQEFTSKTRSHNSGAGSLCVQQRPHSTELTVKIGVDIPQQSPPIFPWITRHAHDIARMCPLPLAYSRANKGKTNSHYSYGPAI